MPVAAGAGEALYKQASVVCNASGVTGAPKFGNKDSWAQRIATGLDTLTATVIKGKGAVPQKVALSRAKPRSGPPSNTW